MYQAHFGLKKGLFEGGIAQGASVFLGVKQQLVVANSKVALTTLDSVIVLTGAAGVGKTTVASAMLRESSTRLALGWLGGIPANASELLEQLLVEFGLNPPRAGRMERLQVWRQFLNETNATDSRVFVIVEHADDLSGALLRALESYTAADPNGCAGANVVLLGEQTLAEQLKAPALDSLRQRIRLRQKLEPLGVDELRAYLDHHVTIAGGVFDKVFAADAVAAIHRYTSGIPRLVNNLCETVLTLAATRGEQQVAADLVATVATSLLGLDEPASTEPPAEVAARSTTTQPAAAPTVQSAPTQTAPPAQPVAAPPAALASLIPAAPATSATVAASPTVAISPMAVTSPTAPAPAPAASSRAAAPPAAPAPLFVRPSTRAAAPARPLAPPATTPSVPPAPATTKAAPAFRTVGSAKPEFAGTETDIVVDELLTDTLVNETPDVQMAEFPVLTDAVDARTPFTRQTKPDSTVARQTVAPTPPQTTPPSTTKYSRSLTAPLASAPKAAAPQPRAPEPNTLGKTAGGVRSTPPKPASADAAAESEEQETKTMRALAAAKSIDDISNSMAETLFGEADLDMLNSAFEAAGWSESDDGAAPEATADKTPADNSDGFDLFDLGPDAPLELIDDSRQPPHVGGRKRVNDR